MVTDIPWPSPRPIVATPASRDLRAVVVIPVRDEAETLAATLGSVVAQVDRQGRPLARSVFEVIVLANNCRDGSAAVARAFAASTPGTSLHVVEVEIARESAHIGSARRMVMDEACRRLFEVGRPRGVIASTDGDTQVGPRWLAETWAEIARGVEAVGGDVRTDRAGRSSLGEPARRAYLADVAYRRLACELEARVDPDPADPWPRHHHHTGASLAVTAEAYRRVGGLPPLRSSEDLALVQALRRSGLAIRHSLNVRVTTSARRIGRAEGGMADTLRRWSEVGSGPLVEPAGVLEARYDLRRRLRESWRDEQAESLWTSEALGGCPAIANDQDMVDVIDAIAGLRRRLSILRRAGVAMGSNFSTLEQVDPIGFLSAPA